jgi:hypothetical protein
MEMLTSLFNAVVDIPNLIAGLLYRFGQYLVHPYVAVLLTCRALKRAGLSSAIMLISAYFVFALSLGIPDTRKLILTFHGELAESLKRLPGIDLKGKEYIYLYLFIVGATVLSLLLAYIIRDLLRLKRGQRGIFIDLFTVYISFTVGWFILLAMLSVTFFSTQTAKAISEFLHIHYLFVNILYVSDVSDIFVSPAFIIILCLSVYFSARFFRHWGLRRSFVDLLRNDATGAISQTSVVTFPILVAAIVIVCPAILLAALSNMMFAQRDDDRDFIYDAACIRVKDKLYANISIKNNLRRDALVGPIFIGLWAKRPAAESDDGTIKLTQDPDQIVRVEPVNFMWASRKGLFLQSGEVRYLRLVGTYNRFVDPTYCRVFNNKRGGSPCNLADTVEPTCTNYQYVVPTVVEGDAVSGSSYLNGAH